MTSKYEKAAMALIPGVVGEYAPETQFTVTSDPWPWWNLAQSTGATTTGSVQMVNQAWEYWNSQYSTGQPYLVVASNAARR